MMGSDQASEPGVAKTNALKLGSCSSCRASKLKCERLEEDSTQACQRCKEEGLVCDRPEYRAGRKKGSKNRKRKLAQVDDASTPTDNPHTDEGDNGNQLFWNGTEQAVAAIPAFTDDRHITRSDWYPLGYLADAVEDSRDESWRGNGPSAIHSSAPADFFGLPHSSLDVGADKDPIDLGLVTLAKAQNLYSFFQNHLSSVRFGLDPRLYTIKIDYLRQRSALLLTSILAGASKFMDGQEATEIRLTAHTFRLLNLVISEGYRSVEIVYSFLVICPWLPAGKHSSEDPTTRYAALCVDMALSLHMDKAVSQLPGDAKRGSTLTSRQALVIDGLGNSPFSDQKISWALRSRQRIWLCVFYFDRAVGLARGRPCLSPVGPAITSCDDWHIHPEALPSDSAIVAIVCLLRGLGPLQDSLRMVRQGRSLSVAGSVIKVLIDDFFQTWTNEWQLIVRPQSPVDGELPPYLAMIAAKTRLSICAALLGDSDGRSDTSATLWSAGHDAAFEVLQKAVAYEPWLIAIVGVSSKLTTIMIAFAVSFVIGINARNPINQFATLSPDQLATVIGALDMMDRVGSRPPHRHGVSSVYSAHLRKVLEKTTGLRHQRVMDGPVNAMDFISDLGPPPTTSQSSTNTDNAMLNWFDSLAWLGLPSIEIAQQ